MHATAPHVRLSRNRKPRRGRGLLDLDYLENKTIIIVDAVNSWNSLFIDDGFSTFEDLLDQIYENLVTKLKFVPDYSCPWNNMLQICFFLHEVYKNIDSATKILKKKKEEKKCLPAYLNYSELATGNIVFFFFALVSCFPAPSLSASPASSLKIMAGSLSNFAQSFSVILAAKFIHDFEIF